MVCLSARCLSALVTSVCWALVPVIGGAQSLLKADFGESGKESVAFYVGSGREVVTLGVSGRNLGATELKGVSAAPTGKVADPVSRLVVFKMPRPQNGAYRLARRAPVGKSLHAPGGTPVAKIEAKIEQVSGKYLPFTLLKVRYDGAPPIPGTPLLDASGAVAAVAHETMSESCGYALPVEVLHRALEAARQGNGVQRAWLGLKLNPVNGSPRVTRVVENSPAAKAGLKAGDVLIEVGGVRISDYGDAVNAFFLLRPGKPTRVKVRRGGSEVALELVPAVSKT